MYMNEDDKKAMKEFGKRRMAGLSHKRIEKLVEEANGDIVAAMFKGYNAGFLKGYRTAIKDGAKK